MIVCHTTLANVGDTSLVSNPPFLPLSLPETSRIFEMESSLLRKVSSHRSIITPPTIHILNFANEFLQLFFSHLPEHKQPPLTELFFSGTCSEAYLYPLYGVTMATKIKVRAGRGRGSVNILR